MMAKGQELVLLQSGKLDPLQAWTSKEAVQKAARMGMHLNPRDLVLSSKQLRNEITIRNTIFQL